MEEFLTHAHHCLDRIFLNLAHVGCDITDYEIDHIGYRTSTMQEAQEVAKIFLEHATLLSETIVSERKVCIYKLHKPLLYKGFTIPSIELLYPKAGKLWSGWDHIEVVIPPYTNSLEIFSKKFHELFPCFSDREIVDSIHTFGTTESPTVSITFPDKSLIRFHSIGVLDII